MYRLIKEISESNEPVMITGKHNNAVLVSEADWRSMQETMFLLSIPGMRESLIKLKDAPDSEFSKELE